MIAAGFVAIILIAIVLWVIGEWYAAWRSRPREDNERHEPKLIMTQKYGDMTIGLKLRTVGNDTFYAVAVTHPGEKPATVGKILEDTIHPPVFDVRTIDGHTAYEFHTAHLQHQPNRAAVELVARGWADCIHKAFVAEDKLSKEIDIPKRQEIIQELENDLKHGARLIYIYEVNNKTGSD